MAANLKTLKRGNNESAYSYIVMNYNGERLLHTYDYYRGKQDVINSLCNMCENRISYKKYIGEKVEIIVKQGDKCVSFIAKLHPIH